MAGQCFGKKHFEVGSEGVQSEILLERKGKVIPCKRDEDGKGPETYRRKSVIQGIWGLRVSA